MNFKVFIKQCRSPRHAAAIAEEIARRSGALPGEVCSVLLESAICVKQRADMHEAMRLKEELEAAGAEVEFELEEAQAAAVPMDEDDDWEDAPGRILTDKELMERLKYRPDIFTMEKDGRLRQLEAACLIAGIASGIYLTKHEVATVVGPDFYSQSPTIITGTLRTEPVDVKDLVREKPKAKPIPPKVAVAIEKEIGKKGGPGSGGHHQGGGDPRKHVTKKGVLGLITGQVKGKYIAGADIFGHGGFARDIDAIIAGKNGLRQGGGAGVGRMGEAGIGYGIGVNSGTGGGGDMGVEDIMGSLLPAGGDLQLAQPAHKGPQVVLKEPPFTSGSGILNGGRSRGSIMRVVMQNLAALRYAYNKRLREKPGLKGKITCKFAIDESGKVLFCEMTESTMTDPVLEAEIVAKIRRWVFDKIDKPGDVTEVVYPFAFSM